MIIPGRDVLRAALRLRGFEWARRAAGKARPASAPVLQYLLDLPIRIANQPVPQHVKRGDTRGAENIGT